jgi:hypothetical protein
MPFLVVPILLPPNLIIQILGQFFSCYRDKSPPPLSLYEPLPEVETRWVIYSLRFFQPVDKLVQVENDMSSVAYEDS